MSAEVREARERRRTETVKSISHWQRVNRMGQFERWVMARVGESSPYRQFLVAIERMEPAEAGAEIVFMAPSVALIETYSDFLRKDPQDASEREFDHKGGAIRKYVGDIGAVCYEFKSSVNPCLSDSVKESIKRWMKQDGQTPSTSFDMEKDMKLMYMSYRKT